MWKLLVESLFFFLPAYVANMAPIFAKSLSLPLAKPINAVLFGSHKTWRGLYAAYLGALLVLIAQKFLWQISWFRNNSVLDYQQINIFLFAIPFGLGAIIGDLMKSFFKRRINKQPGAPWFPFDQIDFVVGALFFLSPLFFPGWAVVTCLIVLTPVFHFLANVIGYWLGLKEVWW
jgi:CDP-2,3-bis-(O-geranylgeranyl)-sn-glycerol synthase